MVEISMTASVNVNGRITGGQDAVISVFDHGFLCGEGVYETLRTYGRSPFLYDRHVHRLRRSAAMIELPVSFSDDELLQRITATTEVADLGTHEAYIRVLLTRGVGELTYDVRATPTPSVGDHREAARRSSRRGLPAWRQRHDLLGADEAFLTGTTREIVPIVSVDGAKIGIGVPEPITLSLLSAFRREALGWFG